LGLCYWQFNIDTSTLGTSFFGNARGLADVPTDLNALSYSIPTFTFASGGGQDILTFNESGVYLLLFYINISYPGSTLTPADICSSATLVGCSCLGSTSNLGTDDPNNCFYSLGTFTTILGGTVTFSNASSLLSLYGSNWAYSFCYVVQLIRLS